MIKYRKKWNLPDINEKRLNSNNEQRLNTNITLYNSHGRRVNRWIFQGLTSHAYTVCIYFKLIDFVFTFLNQIYCPDHEAFTVRIYPIHKWFLFTYFVQKELEGLLPRQCNCSCRNMSHSYKFCFFICLVEKNHLAVKSFMKTWIRHKKLTKKVKT